MKCAVHSDVDAAGFCRNCGKAMCPACVRPVRDVLYCEDCLATIMGIPGTNPASTPNAAPSPTTAFPATSLPQAPASAGPGGNPAAAFLLGLVPGMGAVYNGEYNKALIHVVIFVALVIGASSDVSVGPMVILILSAVGFAFFMAFDAMRVAQAKQRGEFRSDALESWSKNRPVGPIILIGLGALLLLYNFDWFPFYRLERLWPLILIAVGVLLFRNRLSSRP
jgi:hypothetical protein